MPVAAPEPDALPPLDVPEEAVAVEAVGEKSPAEGIFTTLRSQVRDVFPDDDLEAWSYEAEDFEIVELERPENEYGEWFEKKYQGSDDFSKLFTRRMFMVWQELEQTGFVVNGDPLWEHQKALFAWAALNICTGNREEVAQLLIRSPYGSGKSKVSGLIAKAFREAQIDLIMLQQQDPKQIPTGALIFKKKEHGRQNAKGELESVLEVGDLSRKDMRQCWSDMEQCFGTVFTNLFAKPSGAIDPFYDLFKVVQGEDDEEFELLPAKKRVNKYLRECSKTRGSSKRRNEMFEVLEQLIDGRIVFIPDEENVPTPEPAQRRDDHMEGGVSSGLHGDSGHALEERQHYRIKASHPHLAPTSSKYTPKVNDEDPAQFAIVHGSALTRVPENIRRDIQAEIARRCRLLLLDEAGLLNPDSIGDSVCELSREWPLIVGVTGQDKGVRGWKRSPTISESKMIELGLMRPVAYTGMGDPHNPPYVGSQEAYDAYKPYLFEDEETATAMGVESIVDVDLGVVLRPERVHQYATNIREAHEAMGIPVKVFVYHADAKDKKADVLKAFKAPKDEDGCRRILVASDTEIAEALTIPNVNCYDIVDDVSLFALDQVRGRTQHVRNLDLADLRSAIRQQWLAKQRDPYVRSVAKRNGIDLPDEGAVWPDGTSMIDVESHQRDMQRKGIPEAKPIPDTPKARRRKARKKGGTTPAFEGTPLKLTNKHAIEKKRKKEEARARREQIKAEAEQRAAAKRVLPGEDEQAAARAAAQRALEDQPLTDELSADSNDYIFDAQGDDDKFLWGDTKRMFYATDALPGSGAKVDELTRRFELGLPFWHDDDRTDYSLPRRSIASDYGSAEEDEEEEVVAEETKKPRTLKDQVAQEFDILEQDDDDDTLRAQADALIEEARSKAKRQGSHSGPRKNAATPATKAKATIVSDSIEAEPMEEVPVDEEARDAFANLICVDPSLFPDGWDAYMDLNTARIPQSTEGLDGKHLMAVVRGNQRLEEIMKETKTMLPKIIATHRWSVFGRPAKHMATAVDLSGHGYKVMEEDLEGRQPQFHTYELLLDYLEEQGIALGVREQILNLLCMPNLFEQTNRINRIREYEQPRTLLQTIEQIRAGEIDYTLGAQDLIDFYNRLGYDRGHKPHKKHKKDELTMEEAIPGIWSNLHNRGKIGTVPNATEVLNLVDELYDEGKLHALRRTEAIALWVEVKKNQLRSRGIEEPMAELLAYAELEIADTMVWEHYEDDEFAIPIMDEETGEISSEPMTLSITALSDVHQLGDLHALLLSQAEFVPWESIQHIAARVIPSNRLEEFKAAWTGEYEKEQARPGFRNACLERMQEKGLGYPELAKMLGVKIHEDRRKADESERTQRDRPESVVRKIILFNSSSENVPIEGLLQILARDAEDYAQLLKLYSEERKRFYKRTGKLIHGDGLSMRIERELAGVSMKDLAKEFLPTAKHKDAAAVREKDKELQRLERQERRTSITFKRVSGKLKKHMDAKGEAALIALDALNEFPEELKQFSTVQEMAANCVKGLRGATHVSSAMTDVARNQYEWLRYDIVQDIAAGKYTPALPCLRVMAKGAVYKEEKKVLPDEVVRDWSTKFPKQLAQGCPEFSNYKFQSPLARCVCTLIAELNANLIQFFDRVDGIVDTQGTDLLRALDQGEFTEKDWRRVRKILRACGVRPTHIQWMLVDELFKNGQDVSAALKTLQHHIEKLDVEMHPAQLKGLTEEEISVVTF